MRATFQKKEPKINKINQQNTTCYETWAKQDFNPKMQKATAEAFFPKSFKPNKHTTKKNLF